MKSFALIVVLTLALGTSTALAFFLVGGRAALMGSGLILRVWPAIYLLAAAFAVVVGFAVGLRAQREFTFASFARIVFAAWFGEYLVLASGILADELNPFSAVLIWLVATCGPLQPAAALLGARLASRWQRPGPRLT